ncbi:MAG: MOSC domain-containing protein [Oscillospiraceae bacterium]|jgi:molybdenum cofactor synthesis domain-containing protein|nr:MOSC domain-containing protein [Oscillospiraceae bacterium]
MGTVKAVCISEKKGTAKRDVKKAYLSDKGVENDSHAGDWHRQVSLLSYNRVLEFNEKGADVGFGDFGENLVVEGIDFKTLPVGTILKAGTAELKMTQIGKQCHSHCEIFTRMGDCIMPREGVFAVVIKPGMISAGDEMTVSVPLRAAVVTASDKGFRAEREDLSGELIKRIVSAKGYIVTSYKILPDDIDMLKDEFIRIADGNLADVILTTGGTGFSKSDVTPEATIAVCQRLAPGIPEAIRVYSMTVTKRAMLSRAAAGIRGSTLIVNLPGSPKAVEESLTHIIGQLNHGIEILRGDAYECARK